MKLSLQVLSKEISAFTTFVRQSKDMGNTSNFVVVVLACICVVLPLDVSQLAFAVIGAVAFSLLQSIQPKQKHRSLPSKGETLPQAAKWSPRGDKITSRIERPRPQHRAPQHPVPAPSAKEVRKPSAEPVQAPCLTSTDWDMQVVELLHQISPTLADDKIVAQIAAMVKKAIKPMIPEVEVVGFASGDISRKKAFGVAVPEVDIVATVNPIILAERVGGRVGSRHQAFDPKKLQKSAIRACTDRLVSAGGFKFRRSAFRGAEPKVTLLAPGITADAIPIDFTVNAASPLHNAALLTESGQMEPRARELILLVKRWAKDRGICHAAKGHLPPYVWTLLCIFFLQTGMPDGESLLPSLDGFKSAKKVAGRSSGDDEAKPTRTPTGSDKKTAQLFVDFMTFYHEVFDWKNEAISLRQAKRAKPGLKLALHIVVDDIGKSTGVGPSIEDPFNEAHNLGSVMTATSMERLHEELARAHTMCLSGTTTLVDLLEPWAPPDHDSEQNSEQNSETGREEIAKPVETVQKVVAAAPWHKVEA